MSGHKRTSLFLVAASLFLGLSLLANHLVHGFDCWGRQPGGRISAFLYDLQAVLAIVGSVWLIYSLTARKVALYPFRLIEASLLLTAALWVYWCRMEIPTQKMHNQGGENIFAFVLLVMSVISVASYGWRPPQSPPGPEIGSS